MTIIDTQWRSYRLPLRNSFTTAHNVLAAREGAIVEVITDEGIIGRGEIAPLPEFGSGTLAQAVVALPAMAAQLHSCQLNEALDCISIAIEAGTIPTSTACGLETALLDALGQLEGRTVGSLLACLHNDQPGPLSAIPVNAIIGATTTQTVVMAARQAVAAGFGCIKLKVDSNVKEVIERVAAVRQAIGPAVHLRLDANEAWNIEQACSILNQCANYDIQYVEQPLKANDLEGMRKLRQQVSVPVAADEALHNLESVRRLLAEEAADILIIKSQLVGGLRTSRQIIREAAAHGMQCVITSAIESGIGLVAALHLAAASPEVSLECGLATLHLLADDLLVDDLPIHNGSIAVPSAPGLGVRLDRSALEHYTLAMGGCA
ncbi:MAG TPA: o-succinylbenzoate synthase [Ktedonobacteraceae bacterium]|nr:o-succinylbenzoate synthase [Ktedonobacteraceae bacterium]